MKLKHGLIFVCAAMLIAAMCAFTACKGGSSKAASPQAGSSAPKVASPAGKSLTITGLGDYNGKFIAVEGGNSDSSVKGYASYGDSSNIKAVKIANGKAVIPLWTSNADATGFEPYKGADTGFSFLIAISEDENKIGSTTITGGGVQDVSIAKPLAWADVQK